MLVHPCKPMLVHPCKPMLVHPCKPMLVHPCKPGRGGTVRRQMRGQEMM